MSTLAWIIVGWFVLSFFGGILIGAILYHAGKDDV